MGVTVSDERSKWDSPMGDVYSREGEEANAALSQDEAVAKWRRCSREFLEHTVGLKLKSGPMNMYGREAWTGVFIALSRQERYSND